MLSSLLILKVVEETASRDYPLEIRRFWREIGTGVYDILAQSRQRIKWSLRGGTVEFPLAGLLIKRFRKSTSPQMPLDRIPPFYPILHPFWRAPVPYFDRFRSSSKEPTKGSVPESTSAALLIRWARLFYRKMKSASRIQLKGDLIFFVTLFTLLLLGNSAYYTYYV